jgi:pSer/pThr/pTyr-binding forkhead associated (FHA) protein
LKRAHSGEQAGTAMRDPGPPDHRLRVLRGPLEGAAYLLRDSFLLGRSAACDLVLLGGRVSRLHARVGRPATGANAGGGHVLYDLASSNGTLVNGVAIGARPLAPRDEIEIGDHVFRYEPVPALQTAESEAIATPTHPSSPRAWSRTDPHVLPSATARYHGDLVNDVITYRRLANQSARGEALEVSTRERFAVLDARLRDPSTSGGFLQFAFGCSGRLRSASPGELAHRDVDVTALGVTGAAIRTTQPGLAVDDVVHLIFERPWSSRDRVALVGVVAHVDAASCRIAVSFGAGAVSRVPAPAEPRAQRQGFRTRSLASLAG